MRTLSALFTLLLSTTAFAEQPWQHVEFGALAPTGTTTMKLEDFLLDGEHDQVARPLSVVQGVGIGVFTQGGPGQTLDPGESITLTFAPIPAHSLSLELLPYMAGNVAIQYLDRRGRVLVNQTQELFGSLAAISVSPNLEADIPVHAVRVISQSTNLLVGSITYRRITFRPGDTLLFQANAQEPNDEDGAYFYGVAGLTLEMTLTSTTHSVNGMVEVSDLDGTVIATAHFPKSTKRSIRIPKSGWFSLTYGGSDGITQNLSLKTKAVLKKSDAKQSFTLRAIEGAGEHDFEVGFIEGMSADVVLTSTAPGIFALGYGMFDPYEDPVTLLSAHPVKKNGFKLVTPPAAIAGPSRISLDDLAAPAVIQVSIKRTLTPIQGSDVHIDDG